MRSHHALHATSISSIQTDFIRISGCKSLEKMANETLISLQPNSWTSMWMNTTALASVTTIVGVTALICVVRFIRYRKSYKSLVGLSSAQYSMRYCIASICFDSRSARPQLFHLHHTVFSLGTWAPWVKYMHIYR
jgi:hypothetical protein